MIRIAAVVALAAALLSGLTAWVATTNHYTAEIDRLKAEQMAERLRAQVDAAQRREALQARVAQLVEAQQQTKVVEVVKWRTITKEVERVTQQAVYRNCALDADGVLVFNAAALGVRVEDSGGSAAAVSENAPRAEIVRRNDGGSATGGGQGLRAVPRLPNRP